MNVFVILGLLVINVNRITKNSIFTLKITKSLHILSTWKDYQCVKESLTGLITVTDQSDGMVNVMEKSCKYCRWRGKKMKFGN